MASGSSLRVLVVGRAVQQAERRSDWRYRQGGYSIPMVCVSGCAREDDGS